MSIIDCPECNVKSSSFANACPHCGYPIRAMSWDTAAVIIHETRRKRELKVFSLFPTIEWDKGVHELGDKYFDTFKELKRTIAVELNDNRYLVFDVYKGETVLLDLLTSDPLLECLKQAPERLRYHEENYRYISYQLLKVLPKERPKKRPQKIDVEPKTVLPFKQKAA